MDAVDRRLIEATQGGLPLVPEPYRAVGEAIGLEGDEVERRLRRLLSEGVVRRIGLVPNHYALGYRANGMAVWDVADDAGGRAGTARGGARVRHALLPAAAPLAALALQSLLHGTWQEPPGGRGESGPHRHAAGAGPRRSRGALQRENFEEDGSAPWPARGGVGSMFRLSQFMKELAAPTPLAPAPSRPARW